jgi:hypothetical protein
MQQNAMKVFEAQIEKLSRDGDLDNLKSIKAELTDPEMIAVVEKGIADALPSVSGLA